ncbi:MAG: COP23 domain-containing protein [Cyanobacteria bacterium P01_C01_bin.73]
MGSIQRTKLPVKLTGSLLLAGCLAGGILPAIAQTEEPTDGSPRFVCQMQNGVPTVMYLPSSQEQAYPWAVPEDMGDVWPAQRRCDVISERLEFYRPDGLVEMRTGLENGYNTVCVTTETDSSCRIVFTVPQGQDPVATRDRVFENLALADGGQSTEGVTTFTGNGSILERIGGSVFNPGGLTSAINLKPFLAPEDGGTGAQLNGVPGRRLNPNNF